MEVTKPKHVLCLIRNEVRVLSTSVFTIRQNKIVEAALMEKASENKARSKMTGVEFRIIHLGWFVCLGRHFNLLFLASTVAFISYCS